ncbi:MAG: hypothetical protein ACRD29_00245 [Acidimicrobiales bacterium]
MDVGQVIRAAAVIGTSLRVDLLSEVIGVDRLEALDALSESVEAGLVSVSAGRVRFVDAAVRDEVYAGVRLSERVDLHRRVAEVLLVWRDTGRRVDPAEIARHLDAAHGDAGRVGELFVAAGEEAIAAGDYAAAEDYFARSVDALGGDGGSDDELALAWIGAARARLARGDLTAARAGFAAAAGPARRAGRADLLARAALGLGSGSAGFEVPLVDRAQLDLLEEALAVLPSDEVSLRCRLLARLAVALTMVEADERRRALAEDAVEVARSAEDPGGLAAALAARCDVLSGPSYVELRQEMAAEIVRIARQAGDPGLELLGRRHRLVASAEHGDMVVVDAEIREFAALADVLGQPLYGWYVPLWRATRALMEGRVVDCGRWLEDAAATGASAGSHNAVLLTGTLRWCLLSEAADRAGLEALAAEFDRLGLREEPGVWAGVALALMSAEMGRLAVARAAFDSVAPRLAGAPRDSEWLPMLAQASELISHLGSHPVAGWVYEALQPLAGLLVVEGIAAGIRGSVHRHLGLVAAALGRDDQAAEHFASAVEVHERLGAPLLVARTQRDWGFALGNGDALRAALAGYERLGLDARTEEIRRARAPVAVVAGEGEQRFAKEGDSWTVTFADRTARLRDAKGLRDLARLLAAPGVPVPAVALATPRSFEPRVSEATAAELHEEGDLGPALDPAARAAYQRRLGDLDEEIDEADALGDVERAAKAKTERDLLIDQLSAAFGLGGRPRRSGDHVERARTAVTARIRGAIRRIEDVHPELGRHLRASIRTGTLCVYEPEQPAHWTVE